MTTPSSPPSVDLSHGASFANGFPHEFFTWLRAHDPVHWHEPTEHTPGGEGFWVVSRYEDVGYVIRNPQLFSSAVAGGRKGGGTSLEDREEFVNISLNATDDPKHRRLRGLISQGFTPKAIQQLQSEIEERAHQLFDQVSDLQHFDFVHEVARELPLQMICSMLGVPLDERAELVDWIDQGLASDKGDVMDPEIIAKIRQYGADLIEKKRRAPADDMLSAFIAARFEEDGSQLSDAELLGFFSLLFPAGAETTRSALGGAVKAFAEFPEQFERLKNDVELTESAIEEIVRWTTPSIYKRRTAVQDTELGGRKIRRGDKVTHWEMSANRDERAFTDPFTFDIGRRPNKHLGFGGGVHFCLGVSLARMEIKVALDVLTERFQQFEIVGDHAWMPNNRLLGLTKLEICAA